jgi:uroporphyrin-3 C-methyltransferase
MTDTNKTVNSSSEKKQTATSVSPSVSSSSKTKTSSTQSKSESKTKTSPPLDKKNGSPSATAKPGSRWRIVVIVLILVIGGGVSAYVYQAMRNYQTEILQLKQQLQQSLAGINQQVVQLSQDTKAKTTQLINQTETHLNQQQKSIESLQLALADMKGRRPNDWLLAESDYLVKLAGRKLFMDHDVQTATQLMESADRRIAELNDPSLVSLRQAIANDITTLKAIPLIDRDGLILRLTSLERQIDQLPLANAILPNAPHQDKPEVTDSLGDWKHNLLTSLKNFSEQFITFRARDGDVVPLLSPKQDFYLRENLKSKLETAIRAIYDEQQDIYNIALSTAEKWSVSFLDQDNGQVKEFNRSLKQLGQAKIQVRYPVKLESQHLLTTLIHERLRKEVAPLVKENNS